MREIRMLRFLEVALARGRTAPCRGWVTGSGPAAIDAIHLVTDLVATLPPSMERMGIVKASEVELPTLAQRILAEVGADGTLVGRAEVAAWATV